MKITSSALMFAVFLAVEAFTRDFNVILLAGAAQITMWIPPDDKWYETTNMTCVNMWASAYGSCALLSFDHAGVIHGNGPCIFEGLDGSRTTINGDENEGFVAMGPPQQLVAVLCNGVQADF